TATGPDMFAVRDVPHSWLFPKTAAIVHHGGAGTTGAALLAGKPSVIIPQAVDQPFWARLVARQQAGVQAGELTPELRARPLALDVETLRPEHGVETAVAHITAVLPTPRRLAAA